MSAVLSTGQVAALLAVTEPQLNDLIRRGKILPAPAVVAGRRVWLRQHIAQAADHLGVAVPAASSAAIGGGK